MGQTIVAPSVLACDFLNVETELQHLQDLNLENLWIHLDVMDGHFVPNLTFGRPLIKMMIERFPKMTFDAHLMVQNPEFHIEELKGISLNNITIHREACSDDQEAIHLMQKIKAQGMQAGISIRPGTDLSIISDDLYREIDLFLIMSVEPGFGGQGFIPESLDRITQLVNKRNQLNTHFMLQIDGGVSNQNAKEITDRGVENLVAGSYVFKAGPTEYLARINSLLE